MLNENLHGTGASPGIAIGKALVIPSDVIVKEKQKKDPPAQEESKFLEAIDKAKAKISEIKERSLKTIGKEKAGVFEAHLMMLADPEFVSTTVKNIHAKKLSAEESLAETSSQFVAMFESMSDPYLRERASDIREVSSQVLQQLRGSKDIDLSQLKDPVIIVARELTASQTAVMDRSKVLGFITEVGGKTSHTAIMARTLEIPAVLGISGISEIIKNNQSLALNGETGEIVIDPSAEVVNSFNALKKDFDDEHQGLASLVGVETITKDGIKVKLEANMGALQDLPIIKKYDAEGVGLLRTEFLFMNRFTPPTEEEQFDFYEASLKALSPHQVVIRTLDVGGDKEIPYLNIEKETNPFMGLRALRYCLQNKELFSVQLRALLRASVSGNLAIMFPFVTTLEEILEAKAVLDQVKEDLTESGVPFSKDIKIGIMIEIPSAALMSDVFAKHVDFFSIGTNDLIQYVCAVDRTNEAVNGLYDSHNPAVLRLIKLVIDSAKKAGIAVAVCGEMASAPDIIPLLLGMGLTEFSMNPSFVLRARKLIRELSFAEAQKRVEDVLQINS